MRQPARHDPTGSLPRHPCEAPRDRNRSQYRRRGDPDGPHPRQRDPTRPRRRPPPEPAASGTQSRRWATLGDNPLQTVLAAAVVALLVFSLTSNRSRIDRLEDKIDALDAKIDRRFAEQDAKIDEINLKLTALIAALNMTDEVDAALEGRLLDSEPDGAPG